MVAGERTVGQKGNGDTGSDRVAIVLHRSRGRLPQLAVELDLTPEQEEEIVAAIDSDVVSSYLPSFDREDFLLTVFRGNEVRSYSDNQSAGEGSEFPD